MKTNFKSIIYSLIMGIITPLSLHANEPQVFEFKFDDNSIESDIANTLKPVISKVLSNHQRPLGCLPISSDCSKTESYGYGFFYKSEDIGTPKDVYCAAKKECCNNSAKMRNKELFCECYANQLRNLSYKLETINKQNFHNLKLEQGDSCHKYSDTCMESDMLYDRFFYDCSPKNLGNEFCDKLAQTTKKLISAEIINQTENKMLAIYSKFQLYETEYNEIVNSKEFQLLLEKH